MRFLKTDGEGELCVDHSNSPGIPAPTAERFGLPADLVGEGKTLNLATFGCRHCGTPVIKNPLRKRERAHCYVCNSYICDICDAVRHEPGYVHRTIDEIAAKVHSGKWRMAGSMSKPLLIPVED